VRPPTVGEALRLGAKGVLGALWLVPVAMAFWAIGAILASLSSTFLVAVALRGLWAGSGLELLRSPLAAAAAAVASPRAVAIWLGLLLGGLLLRAALRVLWLAGVLPTLGHALAGDGAPAFASGALWGFPRMLATSVLAALLEGMAGTVALGAAATALFLAARSRGGAGAGAPFLAALALAGVLFLLLLAGALGDAALARAGVRGEGPRRAFVAAVVRVGDRPAAFLALSLAVALVTAVVWGSAQAVMSTGLSLLTARLHPLLALFPQLLVGAFGAMLVGIFELWRLGSVAALACHAAPGDMGGPP
jgi:hypothetical protein